MKLIIDPTTEKGQTQVETIAWMQDQLNTVLDLFFAGKYRLVKGMRLQFIIPKDGDMSENIKFVVDTLEPTTLEDLQKSIENVKFNFTEAQDGTNKE